MANRILRDGLMSSESVAGLHDGTFRLYIALLLSADDFGLVELGYGSIREAAPMVDGWTREIVAKMLGELTDARLIFPYQVGIKRYAAIARWKARMNSGRHKFPAPPFGWAHVMEPYAFKDHKVKQEAALILKHLDFARGITAAPPVDPQGSGSVPLGTEGVRGKGKEKGVKKRIRGASPESESFAAFWSLWPQHPRKADKGKCVAKWNSDQCDGKLPQIMANLKAWISSESWRDPQYVPAPLVYLNRKTYDAPAPASHGNGPKSPQQTAFGSFDTTGKLPLP